MMTLNNPSADYLKREAFSNRKIEYNNGRVLPIERFENAP